MRKVQEHGTLRAVLASGLSRRVSGIKASCEGKAGQRGIVRFESARCDDLAFWQLKSSQTALPAQAPEFTPTKGSHKAPRTPMRSAQDCTEEASQAAQWWSSKMRQHDLAASEVQAFETAVRNALTKKCDGHWYPSDPLRGSGYRSLVNDISTDPIFLHAAAEVRIRDVGSRLPRAVMWVNPCSVKVQLENGRYPETVYSMCNSGSNSEGTASDEDELSQ